MTLRTSSRITRRRVVFGDRSLHRSQLHETIIAHIVAITLKSREVLCRESVWVLTPILAPLLRHFERVARVI